MNHIAYHLKNIHFRNKNGLLKFTHGNIKKTLCFQGGNLIFAKTNQPEEKLGTVLYKLGKITKEVYSKIDLLITPRQKLEESLIDQGLISKKDLYETWIHQMREIILNIFPLFKGEFVFEKMNFSDQSLESVISIPLLIENGIRGMKYHPAIKQFMERKVPFQKKKGYSYLLTKEEKDILTLIDSKSAFEAILNSTAYSPELFWKSQYLFYCLDLIGISGEEIEAEEKFEKPRVTPPAKKKVKKVEKARVIPEKKVKVKKVKVAEVEKEKEKKIEKPKEPPVGKIVEKPEPPPARMVKEERVEKPEEPPEKKDEKAKTPEKPPSDKDRERIDEVTALAEQLSGLDYYEILKVSKSASEGEIKKSYFDLARKYHPDSFERELDQQSRKKIDDVFAYITKAYQTLIDKEKRDEYDSSAEAPEVEEDLSRKAEIKFRQGKTLYNMKRYEDAVILLEEAVRLSSSKGRYYLLLAMTESKISTFRRKAEQDFLKAIELESLNSECYVGLGLFYKEEGFKARAKKQFNRALEIDPEHNVALRELEELSEGEEKKGKGLFSFIKKKKGK